jgi:hypothetical protein
VKLQAHRLKLGRGTLPERVAAESGEEQHSPAAEPGHLRSHHGPTSGGLLQKAAGMLDDPWLREPIHLQEAHPLHMPHHRQIQGWQWGQRAQRISPGQ